MDNYEYDGSSPHTIVMRHRRRLEGGYRLHTKTTVEKESLNPVVSIITVVLNGESHIERTIKSVLTQTYKNIEYIIIDGGSVDRTIEIIRGYEEKIFYWLSEPDNGIADAFNKGICVSHGEFINLVNADDWMSPNQIEFGVAALMDSTADFSFGDLFFHDAEGRVLYRIAGDPDYWKVIHSKLSELNHPTMLVRRSAFERVGLFDTQYRCAMDYEWIRRLHFYNGRGIYVKAVLGHMMVGGVSDESFIKTLKEVRDISISYGQPKWRSYLLFVFRGIKGSVRHLIEIKLPAKIYNTLRRLINCRFANS